MPAEAAPSWLYLPVLPPAGTKLALPPDEAHYVTRVCRAAAGDRVRATDGKGTVAALRLERVRGEVTAEVESTESRSRERRAVFVCGAPEASRGDWLIEKLAELGVSAFQPVDCARGSWGRTAVRPARWERLAIAALRQSRAAFLMEILRVLPVEDAIEDPRGDEARWLADPEGPGGQAPPGRTPVVGAVGPAGGFAPEERDLLLHRGFQPIRLAAATLRTETAALALAAWWAAGG